MFVFLFFLFCIEILILLSVFVRCFESNNLVLIDLYFTVILLFKSMTFMSFKFHKFSHSKRRRVTCETAPELRDKSVNVV